MLASFWGGWRRIREDALWVFGFDNDGPVTLDLKLRVLEELLKCASGGRRRITAHLKRGETKEDSGPDHRCFTERDDMDRGVFRTLELTVLRIVLAAAG